MQVQPSWIAAFSSILSYGSQVFGQISSKYFRRIECLQNKAIRIINFANYRVSVNPPYKKFKILKIADYVYIISYF